MLAHPLTTRQLRVQHSKLLSKIKQLEEALRQSQGFFCGLPEIFPEAHVDFLAFLWDNERLGSVCGLGPAHGFEPASDPRPNRTKQKRSQIGSFYYAHLITSTKRGLYKIQSTVLIFGSLS